MKSLVYYIIIYLRSKGRIINIVDRTTSLQEQELEVHKVNFISIVPLTFDTGALSPSYHGTHVLFDACIY